MHLSSDSGFLAFDGPKPDFLNNRIGRATPAPAAAQHVPQPASTAHGRLAILRAHAESTINSSKRKRRRLRGRIRAFVGKLRG